MAKTLRLGTFSKSKGTNLGRVEDAMEAEDSPSK